MIQGIFYARFLPEEGRSPQYPRRSPLRPATTVTWRIRLITTNVANIAAAS